MFPVEANLLLADLLLFEEGYSSKFAIVKEQAWNFWTTSTLD